MSMGTSIPRASSSACVIGSTQRRAGGCGDGDTARAFPFHLAPLDPTSFILRRVSVSSRWEKGKWRASYFLITKSSSGRRDVDATALGFDDDGEGGGDEPGIVVFVF